jgi:polyhydroxyalkanoate synthesis regulator phasin
VKQDRIIKQIDKMVKSGRITEEEAARLRSTEGTPEFDQAMGDVRARHAGAHMEEAVAEGQMSQVEADGYIERLKKGEHPKGLRSHLGQLRRQRSTSKGTS